MEEGAKEERASEAYPPLRIRQRIRRLAQSIAEQGVPATARSHGLDNIDRSLVDLLARFPDSMKGAREYFEAREEVGLPSRRRYCIVACKAVKEEEQRP